MGMLFKNICFFAGIVRAKLTGQFFPLTAILNVTHRCNSNCRYCYASYPHRPVQELSAEQIKKIISDLRLNGCRRISFGGGEPLLRPDIFELADFVETSGMHCVINSNGILVPQFLDKLRKVDTLVISLDGRPPNHDILRGPGSGQKALDAVIMAAEAGIRVHTNTVLHRHNLNDIDYMLELAAKHDFKAEFALVIGKISGDVSAPEDIKPSTDEFRRAIRHIIARKKEGAPVLFSAASYESVLNCWNDFALEGVMTGEPPEGMPRCPAGKFFCLIDAAGVLWACPHLMGKIPAENVLSVGVKQAWRTAGTHGCSGCYQVYHHEFSLLMDLRWPVLRNYIFHK